MERIGKCVAALGGAFTLAAVAASCSSTVTGTDRDASDMQKTSQADFDASPPTCSPAPKPPCSLTGDPLCAPTWKDVQIAQCNGLVDFRSTFRCGAFDRVQYPSVDTAEDDFYGPDGNLVGHVYESYTGLLSCTAYDPSFNLGFVPPGALSGPPVEIPGCVLESSHADCDGGAPPALFDAGSVDDCGSCLPGGTLWWGDVPSPPILTPSASSITCRTYRHPVGATGKTCSVGVPDCVDSVVPQLGDIWNRLTRPDVRTALALGARFGLSGSATVFYLENDSGHFTVGDSCSTSPICTAIPSDVAALVHTLRSLETFELTYPCRNLTDGG